MDGYGASLFRPNDQASVIEDVQMLHNGRQLDHEGPRQVADRGALLLLEPSKNCPPRGIHQGCKGAVELTDSIVHHLVKYKRRLREMSSWRRNDGVEISYRFACTSRPHGSHIHRLGRSPGTDRLRLRGDRVSDRFP